MNIHFKNQHLAAIKILLAFLTIPFFTNIGCTNQTATAASSPPIITPITSPVPPVIMPTRPPWSNIDVYTDASQKIVVKAGDNFVIGFAIMKDLYPIIKEIYDNNVITLIDKKIISETHEQRPIYVWFLFKALKTGEIQLTVQHLLHLSLDLHDQKIFTVVIEPD